MTNSYDTREECRVLQLFDMANFEGIANENWLKVIFALIYMFEPAMKGWSEDNLPILH